MRDAQGYLSRLPTSRKWSPERPARELAKRVAHGLAASYARPDNLSALIMRQVLADVDIAAVTDAVEALFRLHGCDFARRCGQCGHGLALLVGAASKHEGGAQEHGMITVAHHAGAKYVCAYGSHFR